MVLVLFFLSLIAVIFVLSSVLWLQIDIRNLKIYKEANKQIRINKDYEIIINSYIFKKIKIFKYRINNKRISKKYFEKIKNKLDLSILKIFLSKNFNINNIKFIEIEKLNLNLKLGTENVILTSGIVTISNAFLSVFLSKLISNYSKDIYKYEISPVYEHKNKIDLFLESQIKIKLFSVLRAIRIYSIARKNTTKEKEKHSRYNLLKTATI